MFSQLLRMAVQVGGAHACRAKSQCRTSYFVTQKLNYHSLLATTFSQLITAADMLTSDMGKGKGHREAGDTDTQWRFCAPTLFAVSYQSGCLIISLMSALLLSSKSTMEEWSVTNTFDKNWQCVYSQRVGLQPDWALHHRLDRRRMQIQQSK